MRAQAPPSNRFLLKSKRFLLKSTLTLFNRPQFTPKDSAVRGGTPKRPRQPPGASASRYLFCPAVAGPRTSWDVVLGPRIQLGGSRFTSFSNRLPAFSPAPETSWSRPGSDSETGPGPGAEVESGPGPAGSGVYTSRAAASPSVTSDDGGRAAGSRPGSPRAFGGRLGVTGPRAGARRDEKSFPSCETLATGTQPAGTTARAAAGPPAPPGRPGPEAQVKCMASLFLPKFKLVENCAYGSFPRDSCCLSFVALCILRDPGRARGIADIPKSAVLSRGGEALRVTFLICSLTSACSREGVCLPYCKS